MSPNKTRKWNEKTAKGFGLSLLKPDEEFEGVYIGYANSKKVGKDGNPYKIHVFSSEEAPTEEIRCATGSKLDALIEQNSIPVGRLVRLSYTVTNNGFKDYVLLDSEEQIKGAKQFEGQLNF